MDRNWKKGMGTRRNRMGTRRQEKGTEEKLQQEEPKLCRTCQGGWDGRWDEDGVGELRVMGYRGVINTLSNMHSLLNG